MAEMIRLNTRVSKIVNDWLDKRSEETGVPKSTLVFLAVEEYKKNTEVIEMMGDMSTVLTKLEDLEQKIAQK